MNEEKGTKLATGSLIILFGMIAARSFEYGTQIAVARILGPTDYGLVMLGTSILFGLTTVSVFGMDAALSRYISYFSGRGETGRVNGTVIFGIITPMSISLVFGLTLFVLAPLLNHFVFGEESFVPVLQMFAVMVPFSTALIVSTAALRGFERIKYIALVDTFAWKAMRFALVIVVLYLGYELYGVLIGYVISYGIAVGVGIWLLWRSMPALQSIEIRNIISEIVDFAKPMFASRLFGRGRREVDTVFIGALMTSGAVGIYNTAFTLSYALTTGLNAVNTALLPSLSDSYSTGDLNEFQSTYRLGARWSFYFTFPAFIFILVFPGDIIALFFGDQYRPAGMALVLLSAAHC
ncbi:flippase [Saliphagus sp. GCM10025308]